MILWQKGKCFSVSSTIRSTLGNSIENKQEKVDFQK